MKHLLPILLIFFLIPVKGQEIQYGPADIGGYNIHPIGTLELPKEPKPAREDLQEFYDDLNESAMILHIDKQWYAKVIQKRFDKAIAANRYFECDTQFCFEVDEDDTLLRFGIFNRRVIPKRFTNNIMIYYILEDIMCEDGSGVYLE